MTIFTGEDKLRKDTAVPQTPKAEKISENVYALKYFGSSNATLVIADESSILIDAFENDVQATAAKSMIETITDKPVETIIYTHMHADHIGGAKVFENTVKRVIARVPAVPAIEKMDLIGQESKRRMVHQFGFMLSPEESLSMGLNPSAVSTGNVLPLAPTEMLRNSVDEITIDGVTFTCIKAPGETDEQQYVWLKDQNIVCCGDNYYASWPNLSALRGSQYRDVNLWLQSLETLIRLSAGTLLPGHGDTIIGTEAIKECLTNYHDAIEWVLLQTLKGIDEGKTPDDLVETIILPDQWKDLRYLQEYYGTVAWSIRGIYAGYIGWFDGNPTHIGSLPTKTKAEKYLKLCGEETLIEEIQEALKAENREEMQWVCELCDIFLQAGVQIENAKKWKAEACVFLGRMQTSANGRHYYLSCAKMMV